MTSLIIRQYDRGDRDAVISLWENIFSEVTAHNSPSESIERKCEIDDGLFFVAELASKVVGTIMAGYDGHRGWIYSLAVARDHQRQGIGTQLVRSAEIELRNRGCPKVNLQVRSSNALVVAFYQSAGYDAEERISMGKKLAADTSKAGRDESTGVPERH